MIQTDLEPLLGVFRRRLAGVQTDFKRYLYYQIDWRDRLIGIRGARGVGKTTLLLQYIKENILQFKLIYVKIAIKFNVYVIKIMKKLYSLI